MKVERSDWIDMARGYGILLVMLGHLAEWTPVGRVIYSFHIPLFFLLSGYLFSTGRSFRQFAVKKLRGMLVPYFVLAIPLILWDMFVSRGGDHWYLAPMIQGTKVISLNSYGGTFHWDTIKSQPPGTVFLRDGLGLILQERMWTLWFLATLFVLEFLFYVLARFLKKEGLRLAIVLALSAAGYLFDFLGGVALPWNLDAVCTVLPFFYAGFLLRKYGVLERLLFRDMSYPVRKWGALMFTGAVVLNIFFCLLNWAVSGEGLEIFYNQYGFLPVMFLSAFAGCFAVIVLSSLYTIPPVKYIGAHSMVYFVLHQNICLPLFEGILKKLGFLQGDGVIFFVRVVLIVALSCLLLTGVDLLIRKTPLRVILGGPLKDPARRKGTGEKEGGLT